MEHFDQASFRVGDWQVLPAEGVLRCGDRAHRIEPKAMEVLVYLASRPGEVVSRDELEREVWRGALVGYDAVTSTIIKLRKAFGDDPRRPHYIATIPKRGYRLAAVVEPAAGEDAGTDDDRHDAPEGARQRTLAWLAAGGAVIALLAALAFQLWLPGTGTPVDEPLTRTADIPTLAVLPFSNLSGDPEQRYLSSGISEDVITGLSKLSGLRVIARNSTFAYAGIETDPREAAEQLGVRYVLQGSVRRAGDRLRVAARLVDTHSGAYLWAEQFEGAAQDLFALQDRVTNRTAAALSVQLTDTERAGLAARPTTNFDAYDFYLRGRVVYGSLSASESALARAMYRRAINEDPDFALAYAGLALTYIDEFRSSSGPAAQAAAAQAWEMAERAVALDDTLPQAHFAVGYVRLYGRAEHERAIAEAKRALRLSPNYADAYALLSSAYFFAGKLDKTIELDREAMRLNPTSSFVYDMHRGRWHYLNGNYRAALDIFLTSAAKDYNYVPTQVWLAASYAMLGNIDEAKWTAEQVRTLVPGFSVDEWMRQRPYRDPAQRELLIKGLRLAGLE